MKPMAGGNSETRKQKWEVEQKGAKEAKWEMGPNAGAQKNTHQKPFTSSIPSFPFVQILGENLTKGNEGHEDLPGPVSPFATFASFCSIPLFDNFCKNLQAENRFDTNNG
jgi:hypothetical protein